jgi:hypothetical protein
MHHIGILAYGSLITDPGPELAVATRLRIENVPTPFNVEFARSSRGRDGAPTVIPVENGGSSVKAVLLVMRDCVLPDDARNILWRRETNQIGSNKRYTPPESPTLNTVLVAEYFALCNVELVLTTKIGSNISPLTAQELAELAVDSARAKAGSERRDGISYLMDAKKAGIITPLMESYEREVLRLTGGNSLEDAWSCIAAEADHPRFDTGLT